MIRINNNAPIIVILVLFIMLIIQKLGILGITIGAAIICMVALNRLGIIHTRQLLNYAENMSDFLLSNESPLELKGKLDKFQSELFENVNDFNRDKSLETPKELIYNDIGVLADYEKLQMDINKFIDLIDDKSSLNPLDKDRMKRDIGTKIGYIMYNGYLTLNDPYYKGKNYQSCVESQKSLLNEIHSFIYLDFDNDTYYEDEMNSLLDRTIKLNNELNKFLINEIGDLDTLPNDIGEPEPYDINGLGVNEDNRFKHMDLTNNLYF